MSYNINCDIGGSIVFIRRASSGVLCLASTLEGCLACWGAGPSPGTGRCRVGFSGSLWGLVLCAAWWYSTINLQLMYINLYFYLRWRAQVYLLKNREEASTQVQSTARCGGHVTQITLLLPPAGEVQRTLDLVLRVFRARSPSGGCPAPGTSVTMIALIYLCHTFV